MFDFIVAFSFLGAVGALVLFLTAKTEREISGGVKIVDGDSLFVNGEEVRLRGLDAPESQQLCVIRGQQWPCGREASRHLRQLVSRKKVNCNGSNHDRYGRLLAKCYAGGLELGLTMVRDGWAVGFGDYEREEAIAKAANKGIWAGDFDIPQDWRRHERSIDRWSK
ncbi:MAG: thermonuclease family protein [Rhizobiaceae bacterium]